VFHTRGPPAEPAAQTWTTATIPARRPPGDDAVWPAISTTNKRKYKPNTYNKRNYTSITTPCKVRSGVRGRNENRCCASFGAGCSRSRSGGLAKSTLECRSSVLTAHNLLIDILELAHVAALPPVAQETHNVQGQSWTGPAFKVRGHPYYSSSSASALDLAPVSPAKGRDSSSHRQRSLYQQTILHPPRKHSFRPHFPLVEVRFVAATNEHDRSRPATFTNPLHPRAPESNPQSLTLQHRWVDLTESSSMNKRAAAAASKSPYESCHRGFLKWPAARPCPKSCDSATFRKRHHSHTGT